MKPVLILPLILLSTPVLAQERMDTLGAAWNAHIELLEGQPVKLEKTKQAQASFTKFMDSFCSTMRNKQETEDCKAGIDRGGAVLIQQITEMMDSPPPDEADAEEQPWHNAGTLDSNGELQNEELQGGRLSASSVCTDQAVIDEALRVGNANIKPEIANGLKIVRMEKPESIPKMVQEGVKYCRMTAVFNNGMTDGTLVGIATPKGGKTQIVVLPNDGGY